MEFHQLEYFSALSRYESFTRAAEVLHVSQPSVTKGIKALETELGVELINRRIKHVTLTVAGREFLIHVEKILNGIDEAYQSMRLFSENAKPTIHFGVPPMIEAYMFPDFFTRFIAEKPNVTLDIQEFSDSVEIQRRIKTGELDFGIVLGDIAGDGDSELLIMKDKMSLCVYPGHYLENETLVDIGRLRNERFIMQKENTYQYRSVMRCCEQSGFSPRIAYTFTPLKTIKEFIMKREGISILPDFATRNDNKLIKKPIVPEQSFRVLLVWQERQGLRNAGMRLLEFVKQYISSPEFVSNSHRVDLENAGK